MYKSDGTAAGTTDVALLSTNGADVPDITAFDGLIIYGHNNSLASDAQLYATDASGSSVLLKNFGFGRSPSNFTAVGSTLFFTAQDSDGDELWKTDGTASGTTLVEDIVPGSTGSNPTSLFDYDGVLYFSAATAGYGAELWRSDGTAAGTYMVKDLVAGATGSFPANFVTYNGRLYFSANGGIWSSDGTSEGTELAISGRSLLDPQVADGALYFLGSNGSTYGLYRSDGTAAGTVELADNVDPNSGFDVADLSAPNTHYYAYSGGQTISFADPSGDIASLYNSAGVWDTVFGSYGKIYLSNAQAKVIGAGDSLFATGSDNQVKLFSTSGHFDKVFGSDLIAYVVSAEASFIGGANSIRTSGTGNRLKLLSTGDEMDKVFGPNVNVNLASAQASFIGGGDVIRASGTGDVVKLFATFGQFDKVYGANVNAYLINAEASFTQGGDTIHLLNGQNDIVKLFATGANADMVIGSNSTIDVIGAQTKITGSNDKVALFDDDTVSLAGGSFQLLFQPAIGKDTINGFGSTDTMQFSAQDFADFAALQAHLSQSGANTVISLDAADTVTLTNVSMSSLSASQFKFV